MRRQKRNISIFMLFVFGVLSLKVLQGGASNGESCYEFAHIHFYKLHAESQKSLILSDQGDRNRADDGSCHEGKSAAAQAPFPAKIFKFEFPQFQLVSNWFFEPEMNFKSPDLEPHRKPPKVS